jgi:hypothetical protein
MLCVTMGEEEQRNNGAFGWRTWGSFKEGLWTLSTPGASSNGPMHLISFFLMVTTLSQSTFALLTTPPQPHILTPALQSNVWNDSSLLQCLQVASPVLSPLGGCQQTLMVHTFAYSYGNPFIGKWLFQLTLQTSLLFLN